MSLFYNRTTLIILAKPVNTADIEITLREIDDNTTLRDELNFPARAEALDFIEFNVLNPLVVTTDRDARSTAEVKQRCQELKNELEAIDQRFFRKLHKSILKGRFRGLAFKTFICQITGIATSRPGDIGYDELDHLVNGLFSNETLPEPVLPPKPGMIYFQKTPARIVVALERMAMLTGEDVFVDLGSGLGQVVLLIGLMTKSRCIGIEYEPAYHEYAERCRKKFGLNNARFINADALELPYDTGTIFYLYTPFENQMLSGMLALLEKAAHVRRIRVFTYGPCSRIVAGYRWLHWKSGDYNDIYDLCEFVSVW